jgi:3-keto-disaccharide hydrolase
MKKFTTTLLVLLVTSLCIASVASQNVADTPEEGYTALYDGKSLQGWRVIGGKSTYEASGPDIVGRAGPGQNTFLRTEKTYADFSLKMQMRWDEKGNSGILFRSAQREKTGRAYGYQYELDPSPRSWSGGIYDEARRGWIANLEDNQAAREAIRLDDWNDVRIEARGAVIKTWINGVPAADILDGLDASGFIALQVHSGGKGVMRWRNIRIKEYPPSTNSASALTQVGDWGVTGISAVKIGDGELSGVFQDGIGQLVTKGQLSDARLEMTVPACNKPTTIRMRYRPITETSANFAEVQIFANKATARLVTATGETRFKRVKLKRAGEHKFIGLTLGDAATFTVGEKDALRVVTSGLPEGGHVQVYPARCDDDFRIQDISGEIF